MDVSGHHSGHGRRRPASGSLRQSDLDRGTLPPGYCRHWICRFLWNSQGSRGSGRGRAGGDPPNGLVGHAFGQDLGSGRGGIGGVLDRRQPAASGYSRLCQDRPGSLGHRFRIPSGRVRSRNWCGKHCGRETLPLQGGVRFDSTGSDLDGGGLLSSGSAFSTIYRFAHPHGFAGSGQWTSAGTVDCPDSMAIACGSARSRDRVVQHFCLYRDICGLDQRLPFGQSWLFPAVHLVRGLAGRHYWNLVGDLAASGRPASPGSDPGHPFGLSPENHRPGSCSRRRRCAVGPQSRLLCRCTHADCQPRPSGSHPGGSDLFRSLALQALHEIAGGHTHLFFGRAPRHPAGTKRCRPVPG